MNNDRFRRRIQENQNLITIREEKIFEINRALAIETDPERIFSYNKRIAIERGHITGLEREIDEWRSKLEILSEATYPPSKLSECSVQLNMPKVPTGYYHLLRSDKNPLLTFSIVNNTSRDREYQCKAEILRYSDPCIVQLKCNAMSESTGTCLPLLITEKSPRIFINATVLCEIKDKDSSEVILKETKDIQLFSRNSALFAIYDPVKLQWSDFTNYLASWVTFDNESILSFLDKVRAFHPQKTLVGYQGGRSSSERKRIVHDQASAIFNALKAEGIGYINSVVSFGSEPGIAMQRIRYPRESLQDKAANCIDGTVLYASLLTAISINATIFLVPGHAFVGWETWKDSGEYDALETTLIGYSDFDQASSSGNAQYQARLKNGDLNRPIYDKHGFLKMIKIKDTIALDITPQE